MKKIWLNKYGINRYPHLANEWLDVYGYRPDNYSFIIWDRYRCEWGYVKLSECEGEGI